MVCGAMLSGLSRIFIGRPVAVRCRQAVSGRGEGSNLRGGPSIAGAMSASAPRTAVEGGLWDQIKHRYDAAQASGSSAYTDTNTEVLCEPLGPSSASPVVPYIVKIARRLRDKPKNAGKRSASREEKMKNNPFLPPDPNLYVAQLTGTHSLVLNKFNITPHHVIVITDAFEDQEKPLSLEDFEATWMVVRAMGDSGLGGMAFFNGGPLSGASQPHKHIQCVPLPIATTVDGKGLEAPFETIIRKALGEMVALGGARVGSVDALPFVHAVQGVGASTPEVLHQTYGALLDDLEERLRGQWTREDSYNMLLTKEYMMVVPRRAEFIMSVGANAMGFAGSFFLGTQAEIDDLKVLGPSRVLGSLGFGSNDDE